jgi:hypothetical protein
MPSAASAHLDNRGARVLLRVGEHLRHAHELRGHPQPEAQRDKALLSAVVQVPLDPPVTTTGYRPRRRSPGTGWSAARPIWPGAAIPPNPAGLYQ